MNYFLVLGLVLAGYMSLWFGYSVIKHRNDVADVAWGLGLVLLAWVSYLITVAPDYRGLVVGTLVTIWGVRLARHISVRHKGKAEDSRYLAWRQSWGKWFYLRSYAQVYLFQGVLLYLIALPVLLINLSPGPALGWLDAVGVVVWLVGFYFESVGDAQLARFIKDPANTGKLMQSGLWQYTRHPNYFGEVTQWWGIWLMALSSPYRLVAIIGPITITVLILKVSGISMLEKTMAKKPEFAAYKQRTSTFIPWPPKNS